MRALLLALTISAASTAGAQQSSCPTGNLLAGMRPLRSAVGNAALLTDGVVAKKGSSKKSELTTRLRSSDAELIYDLRAPIPIRALLIQAQNYTDLEVGISEDGLTFTSLWEVPRALYGGMHIRTAIGLAGTARFVRLRQTAGVVPAYLSELQAFCVVPDPWPPSLEVREIRKSGLSNKDRKFFGKLAVAALGLLIFVVLMMAPTQEKADQILAWRLAVGFACALLLFSAVWGFGPWGLLIAVPPLTIWMLLLKRREAAHRERLIERGALIIIMVAGAFAWTQFGDFHGRNVIHTWDTFHYYLGGKYFPENGYNGLYHCVLMAERDNGHGREMSQRQARDLVNNVVRPADEMIAEGHPCRERFGPERWQAFRHDVARYRGMVNLEWWLKWFKDHGFNGSPVWLILGHPLTSWGWQGDIGPPELEQAANLKYLPRDQRRRVDAMVAADRATFVDRLERLALVDALLYIGLFALILWAFGLRACALAILVWGTGYPWRFDWTGGALARVPWLFFATASVCLAKRGYGILSGTALTWAMLLRVFPGALAGGLLIKGLWELFRRRRILPAHRRLLIGAGVALAVLIPLGAVVGGGVDAYPAFVQNSLKHKATPLTNHMGLDTLLSWHPAYGARYTKTPTADDQFGLWKEKRRETLESRWLVRWLIVAGLFALVGMAAVRLEDWQVIALGSVLIFGLFELTNYYYVFAILLAPLAVQNLRHLVPYLWLPIVGQGIGRSVGWIDERNVLQSLIFLALLLYLLLDILIRARRKDKELITAVADPAPDPLPAPDSPAPPAAT